MNPTTHITLNKSHINGFPTTCDPWTSGDITGGAVLNNAWWAVAGTRNGSLGHLGNGGWDARFRSSSTTVGDGSNWTRNFYFSRSGTVISAGNADTPTHAASVRCHPE